MLTQKTYSCGICLTTPDQISHHKSHIETQKHKDKRELFEFKISKLSNSELEEKYKTTKIDDIINETETIIYTNKKLKENILHSVSHIKEMATMIEHSTSVSNKEALKDKIHEIHNYLRNNGAGYGMNALKVFNIIYGLKKIEENGLLDKVNLKKPECEFSYLLKLANENKGEKIAELFFGNVLDSISESNIKELLFYEIPKNMKSYAFVHLIKEIDKITIIEKTCNVLLSGKIYEYFIGRDDSAISELGAYFTDRHIVDYIMSKLNPTMNPDSSIDSMVDMFGGSGGFTTGYINYLNEKNPQLIDWTTEINKISHFDMNEDVIKSAGLEFFCLTGILPNMNQLKYKNSFTDDFNGQTYKYPITNPPYGGDKSSKSAAQEKQSKVKEYIKQELLTADEGLRIRRQKQLKKIEAQEKQEKIDNDKSKVSVPMCSARIQKFAKDHKLKGNDKESCSLMLLMDIVEVGGTAIGVLKEGVFFNKAYKDLRKCLVENYNVREVISVPQDQFENTSTKTSIVIFDNTEEKTGEVKFSDLVVERYEEDIFAEIGEDIVIIQNKGDIVGVSDTLVSQATKEEIVENAICSLNGKDYNKKVIVVGEGYKLVKLGDISEINMGSTPSTKNHNYWDDGNIPWVAISDLNNDVVYETKKCLTEYGAETMKNRKIPQNSILLSFKLSIGKLGIAGREMYCNEAITYLNSEKQMIPQMYLYYILEGLNLEKYGRGTIGSNGNLNKEILKTIPIPIPKSPAKIQEWVDKISAPYNEKNEKQLKIKELETFVQNRIREIGEHEECDEVELGSVCDINSETMKNNQFSKINYIDISSVKDECINNIQVFTENFPSRAKRIIKKNDILFSTVRPNLKGYIYISNDIENGVASSGFAVIRCKNINPKYIYSLLKDHKITEYLIANSTGTSYPAVNPRVFENIKIKIPKNKQLIQDLEVVFQQIETLQHDVKHAEESYKSLIQELSQEAMPHPASIVNELPVIDLEVQAPKKVARKKVSKPVMEE